MFQLQTFKKRKSEYFLGTLFHAPGFIFFFIFLALPILFSFFLSFFKWNLIKPMKFVGLANYINMFSRDAEIGQITLNTTIMILEVVIPSMIISLIIAVLLTKIKKGRKFFQLLYFLPMVASSVAISMVWRWIYSKDYGILNFFLRPFIEENINWLYDPKSALLAVSIVMIWQRIPLNTIFYIAAVENVPKELYESAQLDGCRAMGLIRYITIPLVSPTTFFLLILNFINVFLGGFDVVRMLTLGGPFNSSNIFVHYMYEKAFIEFRFGYASAVSFVFSAVIILGLFLQMKLQKKWVHY